MARHEINVPAGNGQAGKAHDLSVKVPSSSPERRNFYCYTMLIVMLHVMLIVSYFAQLNLRVLLLFEHLKNLRLLNTCNAFNNAMLTDTDSDAIPSQLAGLS